MTPLTVKPQQVASALSSQAPSARPEWAQVPYAGADPSELERMRGTEDPFYREEAPYDPMVPDMRTLADTPGWDMLRPGERWFMNVFSKVSGSIGRAASNIAEDLSESEAFQAAKGVPILNAIPYAVGKGLETIAIAADLGAEVPERIGGLVSQYAYAKATNTLPDFWKDFGQAWRAGAFYYNTLPAALDPDTKDFQYEGPLQYGPDELVRVRGWLKEGKTHDQVNNLLLQDMGALYYRGMMADLGLHMAIDLLWILGPVKAALLAKNVPVGVRSGIRMARQAYLTGTAAPEALAEFADATAQARRIAEMSRELGTVAESGSVASRLGADVARAEHLAAAIRPGGALRDAFDYFSKKFGTSPPPFAIERPFEEMEQAIQRAVAAGATGAQRLDGLRALEQLGDAAAAMAAKSESIASGLHGYQSLSSGRRKFIELTGGLPIGLRAEGEAAELFNRRASAFKPWTWFRLTPESRARELLFKVQDHGLLVLRGAKSADQIAERLRYPLRILLDPKMGASAMTLEGRALLGAMARGQIDIDTLLRGFNSADQMKLRESLDQLAKSLKISPTELMGRLDAKDGIATLAGQVVAASKKDARVLEILKTLGLADEAAVGGRLTDFKAIFLDGQVPWDLDLFKLHALGRLNEAAAAQAIVQFGITEKGLWLKATDAIKAAETLAFLRLNPMYPIRNFLNNELTMMARGVWNAMSDTDILKLWGDYAIPGGPSRLAVGYGPAEIALRALRFGGLDSMGGATKLIEAARTGTPGVLDRVMYRFKGGSIKDFGYMAAQIEAGASMRAYTGGFLHFMRENWVLGRGLDSMSTFARASGLTPEGISANLRKSVV